MIHSTTRTTRSRQVSRLAVEVLEDRAVPTSFQWALNGGTNNWTDSTNWQVAAMGGGWAQAPAGTFPGATDTVTFNNTSTKNVTLNTNAIGYVTITAAYTGTISLPQTGVTDQKLTMGGGTILGPGVLTLLGAGNTFTGGVFNNAGIQLGSGGGNSPPPPTASLTIQGPIQLTNGALLSVVGNAAGNELNWQSGSISTVGGGRLNNGGIMRINASDTLGDSNNLTATVLSNSGTLDVFSTPTIAGSFTNSLSSATLILESNANLKIQGTATQTAGTTKLQGGTISVTPGTPSTSIYAVNAGSLVGNGTIAGNLVLGTAANQAVTLSPGIFGTSIGTITVTQSMQIVSNNATTQIEVDAQGNFDKIVVQGAGGWAVLNGTLVVNDSQNYQPGLGTTLTFLTAPSFTAPGSSTASDFTTKTLKFTGPWADPGSGKPLHWTLQQNKPNNGQYSLIAMGQGS